MNKQQLARKIWESANQMRSKIEANEYKDYILGFIFYKYLSDKQIQFAKKEEFSDDDIEALSEEDQDTVEYFKTNIGYFIAYDDLFSTWIKIGKDFDVSNVRDALSAFSRLISPNHRKLFDGVFDTLQTGLSKLGDSAASQTKAISQLIHLIKGIPMDAKQDYDVLGFIYEYLIGMFAANAGKKAGEFYTPHEVSVLMSEIIADHLKDRKEIQIYDPTSGSGSLLINIGQSVAKHIDDKDNIKYFAQELKQNTYNLTRMNLVMRGILPNNIVTRNGDALVEDWPFFDENDPINTYNPLYLDAVVSNPPYSQKWDSENKEADPRYASFGLAPKSKADYAFLLHDLYHLKPDGIMTIILPHGVLFRGGEEGDIRKNLIEKNHIDTIIGLPANIFFGTGIPTIIMVLKQKRKESDVLIVDASKDFIKVGKNNMLRASDIKKIADAVINRENNPKFSKVVSKEKIRENGYNLNIPRYVDSSENAETWDIYSSMFGGIPEKEIDELKEYWDAFPNLREALFSKTSDAYSEIRDENVHGLISEHDDITTFKNSFDTAFKDFSNHLKTRLLDDYTTVKVSREETLISQEIFTRLASIPLIDKYKAYQLLDDEWVKIAVDLEILQTEGFEATKKVDPNIVTKKKDGKEQEVQEGWIGRVMPFELVQENLLTEELEKLTTKENRLVEIGSLLEEIIESLDEEEKKVLNDGNDAFAKSELNNELKEIFKDVKSDKINLLNKYLLLSKKDDKLKFINDNPDLDWKGLDTNADKTYGKPAANKYISRLQSEFEFPEGSYESKLVRASNLLEEEKTLKSQVKNDKIELDNLTIHTIENLTDEQAYNLLEKKWVQPLNNSLHNLPNEIIKDLSFRLEILNNKYATTFANIEEEIKQAKTELSKLIGELKGDEYDVKGMSEFVKFLDVDKMFPKEGETIPEIRFEGFEDEWEEKELSELCNVFTDGDWIESKDQSDYGIRLIQTGNVGLNEFLNKRDKSKWISEGTFDTLNCKEVKSGDILISRLPEPAGRACIVPKLDQKSITSVDCTIVRVSEEICNRDFLIQSLSSKKYFNYVENLLAGGTRQRISRSNLAKYIVKIPSIEEQEKIGNYFKNFDKLTILQKQQLDKLKTLKSACLEKMFV